MIFELSSCVVVVVTKFERVFTRMWNLSFYVWLGAFIRSQMFAVNDGNEDWADLVNPEKYGLTHTQNIYITKDSLEGLEGGLEEGIKSGLGGSGHCPKMAIKWLKSPVTNTPGCFMTCRF